MAVLQLGTSHTAERSRILSGLGYRVSPAFDLNQDCSHPSLALAGTDNFKSKHHERCIAFGTEDEVIARSRRNASWFFGSISKRWR